MQCRARAHRAGTGCPAAAPGTNTEARPAGRADRATEWNCAPRCSGILFHAAAAAHRTRSAATGSSAGCSTLRVGLETTRHDRGHHVRVKWRQPPGDQSGLPDIGAPHRARHCCRDDSIAARCLASSAHAADPPKGRAQMAVMTVSARPAGTHTPRA